MYCDENCDVCDACDRAIRAVLDIKRNGLTTERHCNLRDSVYGEKGLVKRGCKKEVRESIILEGALPEKFQACA